MSYLAVRRGLNGGVRSLAAHGAEHSFRMLSSMGALAEGLPLPLAVERSCTHQEYTGLQHASRSTWLAEAMPAPGAPTRAAQEANSRRSNGPASLGPGNTHLLPPPPRPWNSDLTPGHALPGHVQNLYDGGVPLPERLTPPPSMPSYGGIQGPLTVRSTGAFGLPLCASAALGSAAGPSRAHPGLPSSEPSACPEPKYCALGDAGCMLDEAMGCGFRARSIVDGKRYAADTPKPFDGPMPPITHCGTEVAEGDRPQVHRRTWSHDLVKALEQSRAQQTADMLLCLEGGRWLRTHQQTPSVGSTPKVAHARTSRTAAIKGILKQPGDNPRKSMEAASQGRKKKVSFCRRVIVVEYIV